MLYCESVSGCDHMLELVGGAETCVWGLSYRFVERGRGVCVCMCVCVGKSHVWGGGVPLNNQQRALLCRVYLKHALLICLKTVRFRLLINTICLQSEFWILSVSSSIKTTQTIWEVTSCVCPHWAPWGVTAARCHTAKPTGTSETSVSEHVWGRATSLASYMSYIISLSLYLSLSPSPSLSLQLLSSSVPFDPRLLMRAGRDALLFAAECFVCLVVCVQTSALRKQQRWPTYGLLSYIRDAAWHIGHLAHSHLRLSLSLIYNVSSEYPLMAGEPWPYTKGRAYGSYFFSPAVIHLF